MSSDMLPDGPVGQRGYERAVHVSSADERLI